MSRRDPRVDDYHREGRRIRPAHPPEPARDRARGVDALRLVAAERWRADVPLTFNVRDFERLAVAEGPRILAPPDPPTVESVLR